MMSYLEHIVIVAMYCKSNIAFYYLFICLSCVVYRLKPTMHTIKNC